MGIEHCSHGGQQRLGDKIGIMIGGEQQIHHFDWNVEYGKGGNVKLVWKVGRSQSVMDSNAKARHVFIYPKGSREPMTGNAAVASLDLNHPVT